MPHLFTYGTLMFPEVWGKVVRGQYRNAPVKVRHFKRTQIRVDHYPVILRHLNSPWLEGVVYYNVTPHDLNRLDRFEGTYYERQKTRAVCASGRFISVHTYVLKSQYRHLATNIPWSPDEFQRRHQPQFIARYAAKTVSP